jgi:WD40 repeat protein
MSPDGTWIVSASNDKTLKIWDSGSGAERATLNGHSGVVQECAVSPDGTWIVSAGRDRTLRVWDIVVGAERAALVMSGAAQAMILHPFSPIAAWGDAGGGVHLARLVGIDFGPLVVTATSHDHELTARCPACRETFPVKRAQLGTELACPNPTCNRALRLNQFTLH